MDERKFRILQAIIDDYILTAVPVGSRTISRKYETGLSSATIRNEMSDLEELGYLDQPHVSAGRIPSTKAYRLYVDQLLRSGRIENADPQSLRAHLSDRVRRMEDVVNNAAQVLSDLTQYTALIVTPGGAAMRIRRIQLVPVTSTSILVVVVTDAGIIRDNVIAVEEGLDADTLYAISRTLTERLSDLTFGESISAMGDLVTHMRNQERLLGSVARVMAGVKSEQTSVRITLGGTSNLLNYPEYADAQKARSLLSLLETKEQLMKLLSERQQMAFTVRIGPETGVPELEDCSLVTASYSIGSNARGTIGVLGPTRMQYSRVLSILNSMGRELEALLHPDKE